MSRLFPVLSIALAVVILVVYLQVADHQFLNLDDDVYVTNNPHVAGGITGSNVVWAFTTTDYVFWQPLAWLSHMADVQMFGLHPRGHHLNNVFIHIASALLLFTLLFRITGAIWQSYFVACLFALHPLHVESVAWVAERKDVLSAFFWFLTLLLYAEYIRSRRVLWYLLTLASFILGLMSKPMVLTLPVIMLVMDHWLFNRYLNDDKQLGWRQFSCRVKSLVIEKVPFFFFSMLSAVLTIYGQKQYGGLRSISQISIPFRIENALVSYVAYIGKTIWPTGLSVFYPYPKDLPIWQIVGSFCILTLVSVTAVRFGRRYPCLVVGWVWFVISLVPVIGFFQAGSQAMADRFAHIPGIGLSIMLAWGIPELVKDGRYRGRLLAMSAFVVIVILSALTWHQLGYWHDNVSLYRHTLKHTTDNYIVHNNLGLALAEKGDLDAAIYHYNEVLRIKPDVFTYNNLGNLFMKRGETDSAITEYLRAIQLNADYAVAYNNLGLAFASKGELDSAIREYTEALGIKPDYADARYNLGLAFAAQGDLDAAILEYQKAALLTPNDLDTRLHLGAAFANKGKLDEAITQFQEALRISPNNELASDNLNRALTQKRMQ